MNKPILKSGLWVSLAVATLLSLNSAQAGLFDDWTTHWRADAGLHWASGGPDLDDNKHLFGGTGYIEYTTRRDKLRLHLQSQLQLTDAEDKVELRPGHRLRQVYLDYRGDQFDLRLGRQLMIWGRTDGFNPTDQISPTDFRFLTTADQGQRFGVIGASLRWYLGESDSLLLIFMPEFRSDILPQKLVPDGIPEPVLIRPDDGLDNPQAGIKFEHLGMGFDYSFSFYRGFSTTPGLTLQNNELVLINAPFTMVGADWVVTRGEWALRGEMAYSDYSMNSVFAAGSGPQDNLFTVVGLEHPIFSDDLLLVQALYRWLPDHEALDVFDEPLRSLALFNDIAYSQFEEHQFGITVSLISTFLQDSLRTKVGAAAYFENFNTALTAEVNYSLNDDWTLRASGLWLQGPRESNFGSLEDSSRLFLELKYSLH